MNFNDIINAIVVLSALLGRISFLLNPYVKNELSQPYDLDESTLIIFRGIGSNFSILFHFAMKFMKTNRMPPDGMPNNLGIFRLPLSHKKVARLIWVKQFTWHKHIYSIEVSGMCLYISKAMRYTL